MKVKNGREKQAPIKIDGKEKQALIRINGREKQTPTKNNGSGDAKGRDNFPAFFHKKFFEKLLTMVKISLTSAQNDAIMTIQK